MTNYDSDTDRAGDGFTPADLAHQYGTTTRSSTTWTHYVRITKAERFDDGRTHHYIGSSEVDAWIVAHRTWIVNGRPFYTRHDTIGALTTDGRTMRRVRSGDYWEARPTFPREAVVA